MLFDLIDFNAFHREGLQQLVDQIFGLFRDVVRHEILAFLDAVEQLRHLFVIER